MKYLSRGLPCAGTGYAPVDVWADTSTGTHLLAARRGRLARYLSPQRADVLTVAITAVRAGRWHERRTHAESDRVTLYPNAHLITFITTASTQATAIRMKPEPPIWYAPVTMPIRTHAAPIESRPKNIAFLMGCAPTNPGNVTGEYRDAR